MSANNQRPDWDAGDSAELERIEQLAKLPLWALHLLLAVILVGMVGTAVVLVSSVASRLHLSVTATAVFGVGVTVLVVVGLVIAVLRSKRWQ